MALWCSWDLENVGFGQGSETGQNRGAYKAVYKITLSHNSLRPVFERQNAVQIALEYYGDEYSTLEFDV